jgi:hypothetical protein
MNDITLESLKAFGMTETGDPGFPLEKILLTNDNGNLSISLYRLRNVNEFCIATPNGDAILLTIQSITDLETIERLIGGFDSAF